MTAKDLSKVRHASLEVPVLNNYLPEMFINVAC